MRLFKTGKEAGIILNAPNTNPNHQANFENDDGKYTPSQAFQFESRGKSDIEFEVDVDFIEEKFHNTANEKHCLLSPVTLSYMVKERKIAQRKIFCIFEESNKFG